MANGVQLATAYVSLNVNTNDLGKQIRKTFASMEGQGQAAGRAVGNNLANSLRGTFSSRLGGVSLFAPLQTSGVRWAARAGTTIAMTLKNAISGVMKTAGVGLGIGAGLGAADVIGSGLNRLKVLQAAQVQLRVMKKSAEEIRQITDDVLTVVNGTPIALDDAMQAVPQALGAGVKQGQELTRYITAIGDAAASTGGKAGFGQISMIFSQILGKGKLMSEEVLQLEENGVRIRNALMNTLGITGEELNKRLQDGKIGMQEVQAAVQSTFGGLSKQMGDTFEGAVGNLRAATARLGANILGVIFGDPENPDDPLSGATEGVASLTEKLNDAGEWVKDNREEIRGFFTGARDAAVGLGSAIGTVVDWLKRLWQGAQNIGTQIASAFDRATSAVGRMWTKVTDTFDRIKTKLSDIVDDVKAKFEDIFGENGWFARQFKKLENAINWVRSLFGQGPIAIPFDLTGSSKPLQEDPPFSNPPATPPAGNPSAKNPPSRPAATPPIPPVGRPVPAAPFGELYGQNDPRFVPRQGNAGNPGGSGTQRVLSFDQKITGQKFSWNCGPGSAEIVLNGKGVIKSEEALNMEMGATTSGTPFGGGNISGPLNKALPGANYQEKWTGQMGADRMFSDIAKSVFAGYGAILNYNTVGMGSQGPVPVGLKGTQATPYPGSEIAHYVAVMGVDESDKTLLIADPKDGRQYWISADNAEQLSRQRGYIAAGFAAGGKVRGMGTGTSDSIPAMLSNGEHVLTAKDVSAMGGQDKVYAFRAALQAGMIPGFNVGGAVDPQIVQDAADSASDLQKQYEIARERQREVLANPDASDGDRVRAEINAAQAWRAATQAQADLPIIQSGGTPPDRSQSNALADADDNVRLAELALAEANQEDGVPYSRRLELNAAVAQAQRERDQIRKSQPGQTDYLAEFARSAGFTPTAAGNTGVAGTSSLASLFSSANEVVGGLIDTGSSLAQTAVSAAVTAGAAAGTFGAGAAAAPAANAAASYGIQLAANVGKRLSAFGFQLGAIGADALVAQAMPFGAPRWLGYDYTGFAPQLGIQQAALTTLEKMGTDAINRQFNPQAGPAQPAPPAPAMAPGSEPVATPEAPQPAEPFGTIMQPGDPGFYTGPEMPMWPFNPNAAGGGGGGGSWAKGGAVKVYDEGGILKPGDLALNASTRPEKILTQKQWDSLAKLSPGNSGPMVKIDAIYGLSPEDVASQIESKQKLAMMRYAGRP